MRKLFWKFIDDDGAFNKFGVAVVHIFSLVPVLFLWGAMKSWWGANAYLIWFFGGWGLCGMFVSALYIHTDKPFARWSKSRERENQQSTTSVSDSTIRDTTNEED